jgi:hypothetical protein
MRACHACRRLAAELQAAQEGASAELSGALTALDAMAEELQQPAALPRAVAGLLVRVRGLRAQLGAVRAMLGRVAERCTAQPHVDAGDGFLEPVPMGLFSPQLLRGW